MSEQKSIEEEWGVSKKAERSRGRSLLGPVVLIALGVIFLLANLNIIPQPDWLYALSFWPLLLIFIGLNILVTQVSAPAGTFLSMLVSLAAVGVLGFLLFTGPENAILRSLGFSQPSATTEQQPFNVPLGSIESADIVIDLSNYPVDIRGVADSDNLVQGTIWTSTGLALDSENDGRYASVQVGEESSIQSILNPANWFTDVADRTWRIDLSELVPVNLRVNVGNGSAAVDLHSLSLSQLRLDAANGSLVATLPNGYFDGRIVGGNGSVRVTLPANGRQELQVDGGNGSMTFLLPEGTPARVEFDKGNGSIALDQRFDLVDGDRERGVYQTAGYTHSDDGLLIRLETGNGSFRISQP